MRYLPKVAFSLYALSVLAAIWLLGPQGNDGRFFARWFSYFDPAPAVVLAASDPAALGDATHALLGGPARDGAQPGEAKGIRAKEAWRFRDLNSGVHDAAKASPAVDASGIYVGNDTGRFRKFDLAGKPVWEFYAKDARFGFHSTAALDAQLAYIGAYNGYIYALDKATGRPRWALKAGDAIGSSPVIHGDSIYVAVETNAPRNGYLMRIRRHDGSLLWRSHFLSEQSHSSPAIDPERGFAFLGTNRGMVHAFRIADGSIAWSFRAEGHVKGAMTYVGGFVYGTAWSSRAFKLRAADGAPVWSAHLRDKTQSSVLPVPAAKIAIAASKHEGTIFGIDSETGEIRWKHATGDPSLQISTAVAVKTRGAGWVAWTACGRTRICAFRPADGKVLSEVETGGYLAGEAVFRAGRLYVALDSPTGDLVAYDLE